MAARLAPEQPPDFRLADRARWSARLADSARRGRPLLAHINGDKSWLLLLPLPPRTPVLAPRVAADLIRGWGHFERVVAVPALRARDDWSPAGLPAAAAGLPGGRVAVGRLESADDGLYYHAAMVVAWDAGGGGREALVYAPHGVGSRDLDGLRAAGLRSLALLHGLHDVRIAMAKQLNLGALNGIRAVAATGARYWVATHDEDKTGAGLVALLLRRTRYSLAQAVAHHRQERRDDPRADELPDFRFAELGSGDAICLD